MHKDVINAAIAMSAITRFLDTDELEIFMKYTDFVTKKFAAGEITDADSMLIAIDEFALLLIDLDD